jgi:outer membrane immunogenic protein
VFGAEADIQYSGIKDSKTVNLSVAPFFPTATTVEHKMDLFGTARLRAGYLISDPWLIYATGGLAVGHVKDTASIDFLGGASSAGTASATKLGWTLGGGVEWAFMGRWTAKAEYLYYSLGTNSVDLTPITFSGTATASFPVKGQIARLGVNYRF